MLAASLKTIQKFPILVSSIATTTSHSLSSCFNIYVDRCLHSSQKNSLKICPLISRLFRVISCLPQNKTQPPYHGLCKPCMIWSLLVPLTSSLASLALTCLTIPAFVWLENPKYTPILVLWQCCSHLPRML